MCVHLGAQLATLLSALQLNTRTKQNTSYATPCSMLVYCIKDGDNEVVIMLCSNWIQECNMCRMMNLNYLTCIIKKKILLYIYYYNNVLLSGESALFWKTYMVDINGQSIHISVWRTKI